MLTYIIVTGIVVFAFATVIWLGTFLLNRVIYTTLETAREERRNVSGQLGYGFILLGLTLVLGVVLFQMDRDQIIPDMPPGLQPEGVRRQAVSEQESKIKQVIAPTPTTEAALPKPKPPVPKKRTAPPHITESPRVNEPPRSMAV